MKKLLVCLFLLLILSGCGSRETMEYVRDVQPVGEVPCWQDTAYTISLGLPDGAKELENGRYSVDEGALEIEKRMFLASNLEQAVKTVSGLEADRLTVLKTTRFDLPEYQFSWYDETGSRLYRADVVRDGMECYAVVCSRPEAAGTKYEAPMRRTFATFGLFVDEGV